MNREIRVLIVEDDFFARNWMELLLRRDWRTDVVGEVSTPADLTAAIDKINKELKSVDSKDRIDLVLIDTDIPHDSRWLPDVLDSLYKHRPKTAILFTGVAPDPEIIKLLNKPNVKGYIVKEEIAYSLVWAVELAVENRLVITPGVCDFLSKNGYRMPSGTLILSPKEDKTWEHNLKRLRMAFIFSMERAEIAGELKISEDYTYGVISALYDKIGLTDILQGEETDITAYFGNNPIVLKHVRDAVEELRKDAQASKKTTGKGGENQDTQKKNKVKAQETLAFHLLTLPDIEVVP